MQPMGLALTFRMAAESTQAYRQCQCCHHEMPGRHLVREEVFSTDAPGRKQPHRTLVHTVPESY